MGLLERALKYRQQRKKNKEESVALVDKEEETSEVSELLESEQDTSYQQSEESHAIDIIDQFNIEEELNEESNDAESELILDDLETVQHDEEVLNLAPEDIVAEESSFEAISDGEKKSTIEKNNPDISEKKSKDYWVLYELSKEIMRTESLADLFDVMLFSAMGQIGSSSASIICEDITGKQDSDTNIEQVNKWVLKDKRGVKLKNEDISFSVTDFIISKLVTDKTYLDIEEYKNDDKVKAEYLNFVSIDARMVFPFISGNSVFGALCLGEKITIGDYTDDEIEFIKSICDIFSIVYKKLSKLEITEYENIKLKRHEKNLESLEKSEHRLKEAQTNQQFEENIYQEMHSFEIDNYAFFSYDTLADKFIVKYADKSDIYDLHKTNHEIKSSTVLTNFLSSAESMTFLDSTLLPDFFAKNFNKKILSKAGLIAICPYIVGDIPLGFLLILNVNKADLDDKKHLVISFAKSVFSYLEGQKSYSQVSGTFVDNLELMYQRMNKELINVSGLKIPLTLALLSIKNYKRYISQVDYASAQKLMSDFGDLIADRLDDSDFCYRYDRNKILVVMPGKNKKYALPLINTVRNELSDHYNNETVQLLITYLLAEYPKDGKDLSELLDCID